VSATTVKLLQVASEIVGGDQVLAERLGISERVLRMFVNQVVEMPDVLLLRAVDIILAERQSPSLTGNGDGSSCGTPA
jgi:hypothetical protein